MSTKNTFRFPHKKNIGLLIGPGLFFLIQYMTLPAGMTPEAQAVLACTVWVAVWWITEAVPIPIASLLPVVIFPLSGALSLGQTTASYGNPIVFLFMGGFIMALSMEKWNLHKRIALSTILLVGTNPAKVVLGFMIATGFLSMWISNTATAMMMMPIGLAVTKQFAHLDATGKATSFFGKALMLGIAYAASLGGMATLIGTPANAIMAGIVQQNLGTPLSFFDWMKFAFPLTCLLLAICWIYLVRVAFPLDKSVSQRAVHDTIAEELKALGKPSTEEKWIGMVFIFIAACWITRTFLLNRIFPALDDSMIAILGALILFLIPAPSKAYKEALLTWEIGKKLPWGILLLFGGGLAIAAGFETTGLATWIGKKMMLLSSIPDFLIILAIVGTINFLTEITSNTATATMMLPIMVSLGAATGMHPYAPMLAACLASSCAFMLPVATPPNAIVFGSGYFTMKEMAGKGFWLNIITIIMITFFIYYLLSPIWGINIFGG